MKLSRGAFAGILATGLLLCALAGAQSPPALTGDAIPTARGNLVIHPINHASFVMSWQGHIIYVDPVGGAAPYQGLPRPDLIFITHIHGDHFDPPTLNALILPATRIIAPHNVHDAMPANLQAHTQAMKNGDTATLDGIGIDAIPMYNTTPARLKYHPKGLGNGYVLTFANKRVYIAGDTEPTPAMLALTNIDVAFVPMNLPFTMTVPEAAKAVVAFKPKIVYPYHYRGSDVNQFKQLVETQDPSIDVRLRKWY